MPGYSSPNATDFCKLSAVASTCCLPRWKHRRCSGSRRSFVRKDRAFIESKWRSWPERSISTVCTAFHRPAQATVAHLSRRPNDIWDMDMNSNSNGRLALYGATALVAAMIGGGITAAASIAAAEAPAVPPIPAIPAMPASMQAGPAIRAVPVPPARLCHLQRPIASLRSTSLSRPPRRR